MKTVGPAISLRTSCCDFPQKEQYKVLFESEPVSFVIPGLSSSGARDGGSSRGPDIYPWSY
jgi:hypothetical protein